MSVVRPLLFAACLVAVACTTSAPPTGPGPVPPMATGPCGLSAAPSFADHVIWIWMENHDYADVIGASAAPYATDLAARCAVVTDFHSVGSPSLPNYIAAASGSTQGITDNDVPLAHPIGVPNIFSLVKASGREWRSYQESAPGNCSSATTALYAVKHDPAPYFTNIAVDCLSWDVPMGTTSSGNFLSDLNAGHLPAFASITPNLCNDTHDCSVATGDQWLAAWIPKIVAAPNYVAGDTAIFIVWDEGRAADHVPAIIVSPFTRVGAVSNTRFDHYSLLKTTEQLLGLSPNLANASSATSMLAVFFSGSIGVPQRIIERFEF